jgi:hypothetical protein
MDYTEITECRACANQELVTILDLNDQPLANSYHKGEDLKEYPLALNLCDKCFHLQLSIVVNPDLMFKNYLYVSGTSKTLRDYFDDFAIQVVNYDDYPVDTVLDIACNDGSQLDSFKKLGCITYGVDPAENLHQTAVDKGHDVICDYWTSEVAAKLHQQFDVITAQNVFAHTNDIHSFLRTCSDVMHSETKLFIQTSQADMVPNGEFDTIYHEHLSFFSLKSMMAIAERSGLVVADVFKTPIHGDSYVFVLALPPASKRSYPSVDKMYADEETEGRYLIKTYVKYAQNCQSIVDNLNSKLDKYRAQGLPVVGYGAAAKGNTLLNFGKIKLDYIVDDNPLKWNLLTPGMNIEIKDPKVLSDEKGSIVVVPLAWNFYKEISKKVKGYRPDEENIFVRYFPELIVETM